MGSCLVSGTAAGPGTTSTGPTAAVVNDLPATFGEDFAVRLGRDLVAGFERAFDVSLGRGLEDRFAAARPVRTDAWRPAAFAAFLIGPAFLARRPAPGRRCLAMFFPALTSG